MRAQLWFRIASVLLLLFAAGHTYGFLAFKPLTNEGRQVFSDMQMVRLVPDGTFTYGGFYTGFGLFISVLILFLAWMSWQFGRMAVAMPQEAGAFAWTLALLHLIELGLASRYFAMPPVIMSGAIAVCFVVAALSARHELVLR